jgi:predicted RNA binding protein YcfA (HicA-like mRNA interferase family)
MRDISGRELARALERKGWTLLRINGSHHVYGREDSGARLTVPIHADQPLKMGLLHHLAKTAGLSEDDL